MAVSQWSEPPAQLRCTLSHFSNESLALLFWLRKMTFKTFILMWPVCRTKLFKKSVITSIFCFCPDQYEIHWVIEDIAYSLSINSLITLKQIHSIESYFLSRKHCMLVSELEYRFRFRYSSSILLRWVKGWKWYTGVQFRHKHEPPWSTEI